jgi:hypothetical protein
MLDVSTPPRLGEKRSVMAKQQARDGQPGRPGVRLIGSETTFFAVQTDDRLHDGCRACVRRQERPRW